MISYYHNTISFLIISIFYRFCDDIFQVCVLWHYTTQPYSLNFGRANQYLEQNCAYTVLKKVHHVHVLLVYTFVVIFFATFGNVCGIADETFGICVIVIGNVCGMDVLKWLGTIVLCSFYFDHVFYVLRQFFEVQQRYSLYR